MWRSCVCRESFHRSVCCLDTKLLPPVQRAGWGPAPAHYSSSSHHPSGKSAPLVSLSLQCKWWVAEDTGQFSETGLHDWTSFTIFCTRSRERSQLSLPGQFLSRCWFTLCITMEAELRIAKQDQCHHCCNCKNIGLKITREGWCRVEKKGLYIVFWLTKKLQVCGKNAVWGII